MKIVNLTPHTLNIVGATGGVIEIEPSGQVARVAQSREKVGHILEGWVHIPLFKQEFGEVEGLPGVDTYSGVDDGNYNTMYVVSGMVLSALKGTRLDVYAPGELVRNEAGQVVGCKGLAR